MAKSKQLQKFDEVGLKELTGKLVANKKRLAEMLRTCKDGIDFNDAVRLRDAAQYLTTTCLTIEFIQGTMMNLVRLSGQAESVPHLTDCGLEWLGDDDE